MNTQSDSKTTYFDTLATAARQLPSDVPGWVSALRDEGLARLQELGFPTTREEDWKYTNVSPIERHRFIPAPRGVNGVSQAEVQALAFENLDAHRLVFVNGYYAPGLSTVGALSSGVTAGSLAEALASRPEAMEPYLGRLAPLDSHGFAALNAAFLGDGAYVHLAGGAAADKPIHLLFISTEGDDRQMTQPRNLVVAEAGSRAILIEQYASIGESRYFTNGLTETVVESGASVEHYRVQQESPKAYHIGGLYARLGRDSRFTSHAIDLGGLLVRNDVRGVLHAGGAECVLNGLYIVDGRQHVDNHTHVDHASPNGTSREFYKGILDGRARAVFNGRVVVHPDAQHTDAQQMNNNLLLSEDAEIDTKPQLEIYADDVKCSHGATVGQLDAEALFYLRSRAVDEGSARDLLTYAFANDILGKIGLAPIRLQLERRLTTRLLHGRSIRELELV